MNTIIWNDKTMSLGIPLIDAQHKELLNIINQLSTSIYSNTQKKDIFMIINKLIDYANFHFTCEEELFNNLKYNKKDEHKNEHREFLNKFTKYHNQISNSEYLNQVEIIISQETLIYLVDWFLHHIAGTDRIYAEIFIGKQEPVK